MFSWSELYLPSQSCLLPLYITLPSDLQFTKYAVLYFVRITFWHLSVIIFASDIFLHGITSTCPLRLFSQLHSSAYESTAKLFGSPFLHRNHHISDMHWSYFLLVCFCLWFSRLWWGWNCLAQNVVQCRSWIKYVNRKIKLCLHLLNILKIFRKHYWYQNFECWVWGNSETACLLSSLSVFLCPDSVYPLSILLVSKPP